MTDLRNVTRSHDRLRRIENRLQQVPEGDAATEALLDAVKALVDLLKEAAGCRS